MRVRTDTKPTRTHVLAHAYMGVRQRRRHTMRTCVMRVIALPFLCTTDAARVLFDHDCCEVRLCEGLVLAWAADWIRDGYNAEPACTRRPDENNSIALQRNFATFSLIYRRQLYSISAHAHVAECAHALDARDDDKKYNTITGLFVICIDTAALNIRRIFNFNRIQRDSFLCRCQCPVYAWYVVMSAHV